MDRALLFSHSTMTSCFACVGFVLKGCLETLDLVARSLGLQREQLRVSHTDSIPSDAGSFANVAESIPSDEDYDAGSILNDADSIPSDAGSISNDADSIPSNAGSNSNVAESIPGDEDYDAGSILNDADSIPSDAGSISNDADSIPSDAGSISNVAESIPSDEDYDARSILNDSDSILRDAGSISNDADSIPSDADSIPGDTNSSLRDTNSVAAVTLFQHCRDAATAVCLQCERVRINKSLCRLLGRIKTCHTVWRDVGAAVDRQGLVDVSGELFRFRVHQGKGRPPPERVSFLRPGAQADC
jgi:hypothetical protein